VLGLDFLNYKVGTEMAEKEPNITFLTHRAEYHFPYIPMGNRLA
jgi:hypothetical protein